jgi:hypothetical protein
MITNYQAIESAQRIMAAVTEEAPIAQMIHEGHADVRVLNAFNRQNIIRTQLVAHSWRKIGRQVLAMHPAVVDEVKVATSDKIPGEVLRTLPYMNPLVIYPEPPVFKSWLRPGQAHRLTGNRDESAMRLLGFFTYGTANVSVPNTGQGADAAAKALQSMKVEQRIYSTTAPEADRFGMMLIFEALDSQDQVIDIEFNSVSLFFDETKTLAESVDELMNRYRWDAPDVGDIKRNKKWMREVLGVVIGSLFYLCSTTLEAEKVPAKAVAKLTKSISRKPMSLYRVGWTTGAALTRYRQSRPSGWKESEQPDITHQQDPQHRKAHFKMQPYGPRNSLRKLILVGAYWTHVERLGEMGMNTAHAVPVAGPRGEARESVRTALALRDVPTD